jgi:multidrug efflux system membrane fusion protein
VARDRAQLASAQSDADRAAMLAERGIVSTQQRDQMIANAKAIAATMAANEAALERAQLNYSYTTIRAPIDGKTGPHLVHAGNLVRANDANGLVVINDIQPVKVTFAMPQNLLPQLQDRMREGTLSATLAVHSENAAPTVAPINESEVTAKVEFIGNVVDERSGTIELRATHPNSDLRMVPGELVDVSVHLDTLMASTVVPRSAVIIGQDGGTYIWVLNEANEAEMRPVRMTYQDDQIAAVGDVVKMGERVVTDGQLRLTQGAEVTIVEEGAVSAPPAPPRGGRQGGQGGGRRGGG